MTSVRFIALICAALPMLSGCSSVQLSPLIGEDAEVYTLLGQRPDNDAASSGLAAARRLHQALIQKDNTTVWELLATATREALDERGSLAALSGRELIDTSSLPTLQGTVRRVRYEDVFFGSSLAELREIPGGDATRQEIAARAANGSENTLVFVKEGDTWKLLRTSF